MIWGFCTCFIGDSSKNLTLMCMSYCCIISEFRRERRFSESIDWSSCSCWISRNYWSYLFCLSLPFFCPSLLCDCFCSLKELLDDFWRSRECLFEFFKMLCGRLFFRGMSSLLVGVDVLSIGSIRKFLDLYGDGKSEGLKSTLHVDFLNFLVSSGTCSCTSSKLRRFWLSVSFLARLSSAHGIPFAWIKASSTLILSNLVIVFESELMKSSAVSRLLQLANKSSIPSFSLSGFSEIVRTSKH